MQAGRRRSSLYAADRCVSRPALDAVAGVKATCELFNGRWWSTQSPMESPYLLLDVEAERRKRGQPSGAVCGLDWLCTVPSQGIFDHLRSVLGARTTRPFGRSSKDDPGSPKWFGDGPRRGGQSPRARVETVAGKTASPHKQAWESPSGEIASTS